MTRKPGGTTWLIWLAVYTASYMLFEFFMDRASAWVSLPTALLSSAVSAALTWLFLYRRWSKSDSFY